MQGEDDDSDISAHLYPAVHYLFSVLFYLLGHCKALWPFLYLIFKYFISRSLPTPSPSHSAVLAHFSVQLISMASSNSAFLPPCSAQRLSLPRLNHFFFTISCFSSILALYHHTPQSLCFIVPLIKLPFIPFCVTVTKPNRTTPYPSPELKPLVLAYVPSRCSRRRYPGSTTSS